jgi:hypothetical protein
MPKPKKTFFEQVPLAVVKKIAGVEVSVNHAVASHATVRKRKTSKARRPATFIASPSGGRQGGSL